MDDVKKLITDTFRRLEDIGDIRNIDLVYKIFVIDELVDNIDKAYQDYVSQDDYDIGHDDGYQEGHEYGYQDGFTDGRDEGYDNGYDAGYAKGFEEGQKKVNDEN